MQTAAACQFHFDQVPAHDENKFPGVRFPPYPFPFHPFEKDKIQTEPILQL
jgi:hypothetical protein